MSMRDLLPWKGEFAITLPRSAEAPHKAKRIATNGK
jgi:hypothetical protein